MRTRDFASLGVGVVGLLVGCGSSNAGVAGGNGSSASSTCSAYEVPAETSLAQPTVSFRGDVMPIFRQSCAFSSCHGSATNHRVYLGSPSTEADPSKVRAGIVGVPATELSTMSYVAAGDPGKSFLLHKLDGDL